MREFLVFRLYGPLASWGEIAVGERRGSWSRPSKSAVLGLVAGAIGIERSETGKQAAFAAGYGFAVLVDCPGIPLRDYHSSQTAREADLKKIRITDPRPLTRRRELSVNEPETILSQRDYHADALYSAALWARDGAPLPLSGLAEALRRPRFAPYLGRKSCPPALPFAPEVIAAEDLLKAFDAYQPPEPPELGKPLSAFLNRRDVPSLIAWEDDVVPPGALARLHVERRRDAPGDRLRWHFAERDEQVGFMR